MILLSSGVISIQNIGDYGSSQLLFFNICNLFIVMIVLIIVEWFPVALLVLNSELSFFSTINSREISLSYFTHKALV